MQSTGEGLSSTRVSHLEALTPAAEHPSSGLLINGQEGEGGGQAPPQVCSLARMAPRTLGRKRIGLPVPSEGSGHDMEEARSKVRERGTQSVPAFVYSRSLSPVLPDFYVGFLM